MRAELLRLRGEMELIADPSAIEKAESLFEQAADFAGRRGARSWHLRAVTSLARLLSFTGRSREARDRLAPLYESFTEGFASPDLRWARSLLDALCEGQSAPARPPGPAQYRFW